jgi:hypothetical protein
MRFTTELLKELDDTSTTITSSAACITFTTTTSNDKSFQKTATSSIPNPNANVPQEKLEPLYKKLGFHVS